MECSPKHPATAAGMTAIGDNGRSYGVYLWAGSGTIALQRMKFPDRAIDEDAHMSAYTAQSAADIAACGVNVAFLTMNWGFPPEIERDHWTEFEHAASVYREHGIRVIGYVQASNCMLTGSYADKDWYAVDHAGNRFPYYPGRFMTCWNHAGWLREVEAHALRAMDLGASGVFFDNVWMGATPWMIGRKLGGFAGCACPRCADSFGAPIPRTILHAANATQYLDWRRDIVTATIRRWSGAVRKRYPDAGIYLNNCDAMLRDTRSLFGLDVAQLAPLQNALLVENVAMPRHDRAAGRLFSNALPIKAIQAQSDKPIWLVSYEHGIGLDRRPDPKRLSRLIFETVALGAHPMFKASEYLDPEKRFSVISARAFAPVRATMRTQLDWICAHAELFEQLEPDPAVGILIMPDDPFHTWANSAYELAQTLLLRGIPFCFCRDPRSGPPVVIIPTDTHPKSPALRDNQVLIRVPARRERDSRVPAFVAAALDRFPRWYFGSARVRRTFDALGITAHFLRSEFFRLPNRASLLAHEHLPEPPVYTTEPVLVERYLRQDGATLLHLLNYSDQPTQVIVPDGGYTLHSPDRIRRTASETEFELTTFAVLEWPGVSSRHAR